MTEKETKHLNFAIIGNAPADKIEPIEKAPKNGGMVQFGEDNLFPQALYELYEHCSILKSIINGVGDYAAGSGFEEGDEDRMVNKRQTALDLVQECVNNYAVYGAFAVQVIRNAYGDIIEYHSIDPACVRLDETEDEVYYNSQWCKYAKNTKVYPRYDKTIKEGNSIFYFKAPRTKGIYGKPMWSSALTEVQTAVKIADFHYNSLENGLHTPFILSFNNGVPSQEEREEIEAKVNEKFAGSGNASRVMISWNESSENGTTIASVPDDNFDTKYQALKESVTESILTSFRASAQLFGVSSQSTGFSSIEYQDAFKLFNKTVIEPIQRQVERAFAEIGLNFKLRTFEIEFDSQNNNNIQMKK